MTRVEPRTTGGGINISFDGQPVRLTLESGRLLLIDPLTLDGLAQELVDVSGASSSEQPALLRALAAHGLRIGLEVLPDFRPGVYQLDLDSFESTDGADPHPGVFQVDSGTVVVIDLAALPRVARTLTWDRYDDLLQSPIGDDSRLTTINDEIGGPRFAIITADASRRFSGDGAFRLQTAQITRVV